MIDGKFGHFSVVQEPIAFKYTIPISDYIDEVSTVLDPLHKIPNTTEMDYVELIINSGGGNLDTMLGLVDALDNCPAHVHARVSGTCASAATFPLFKCDSIHVAKGTYFLFHNASYGMWPTDANEMDRHTTFHKRRIDNIIKDIYSGF